MHRYKLVWSIDWDDTCLPTTALETEARLQGRTCFTAQFSPLTVAYLHVLDVVLVAMFTRLREYGTIYIVTNAEPGWVQLTAHYFLPRTYAYLQGYDSKDGSTGDSEPSKSSGRRPIPIISAWATYHLRCPLASMDGADWKYVTMCCILQLERRRVYLFSIGDSDNERLAAKRVQASPTSTLCPRPFKVRSLKTGVAPSLPGLIRQLQWLHGTLPRLIFGAIGDDLMFQVSTPHLQ